jgi:hypothetical protein
MSSRNITACHNPDKLTDPAFGSNIFSGLEQSDDTGAAAAGVGGAGG